MAVTVYRLGITALRYTYRVRPRRIIHAPITPSCTLHTTSIYRDEDSQTSSKASKASKPSKPSSFLASLHPDDRSFYESLSPEDRQDFERTAQRLEEHMSSPEVESSISAEVSSAAYAVATESPQADVPINPIRPGLMSMGEIEEQDSGEDEEWGEDDMTSLGHGELEKHREMREYARLAAWELPLLSKLAKPFIPPSLDSPLRFRYTTYMGESHPAQKKVVLEFCTADIPSLTPAQRLKLVKLVGVRYDPQTDIVKMSSEMFETQAQNKRYLGDLVDTLVAEARGENAQDEGGKDAFDDVAVDFRHVKWKPRKVFPEEWKLTAERKRQLEADRMQRAEAEQERVEAGQVVEGIKFIEAALRAAPVRIESKVVVEAQQGKGKGKGKKRALLR